jgi:hypothetical protein
LVKLFKSITVQNGNSKFQINKFGKQNVSIQLYLALERGIFIEFTTGFTINLMEQSHRPPIKQHRQQTNFLLTSKIRLVNLINKDLGDNILIDSMWLDS